jgi:hypothetical protein
MLLAQSTPEVVVFTHHQLIEIDLGLCGSNSPQILQIGELTHPSPSCGKRGVKKSKENPLCAAERVIERSDDRVS